MSIDLTTSTGPGEGNTEESNEEEDPLMQMLSDIMNKVESERYKFKTFVDPRTPEQKRLEILSTMKDPIPHIMVRLPFADFATPHRLSEIE